MRAVTPESQSDLAQAMRQPAGWIPERGNDLGFVILADIPLTTALGREPRYKDSAEMLLDAWLERNDVKADRAGSELTVGLHRTYLKRVNRAHSDKYVAYLAIDGGPASGSGRRAVTPLFQELRAATRMTNFSDKPNADLRAEKAAEALAKGLAPEFAIALGGISAEMAHNRMPALEAILDPSLLPTTITLGAVGIHRTPMASGGAS